MGHQQHWTKVRSCFVSLKLIKHQGLQCFSVGLATPFILPRCSTFLTGKDALYLVSLQMWTNVILSPYQSPTRLLYGSAILNGMGAALLWTSQVQNLTSQTSKNTFPLTGKISGAKSNNSDVQKYFYSHRESFLPSTQRRTLSGATLVSSGFSIRWVEFLGRPLFWCFFAMWTWLTRLAF